MDFLFLSFGPAHEHHKQLLQFLFLLCLHFLLSPNSRTRHKSLITLDLRLRSWACENWFWSDWIPSYLDISFFPKFTKFCKLRKELNQISLSTFSQHKMSKSIFKKPPPIRSLLYPQHLQSKNKKPLTSIQNHQITEN